MIVVDTLKHNTVDSVATEENYKRIIHYPKFKIKIILLKIILQTRIPSFNTWFFGDHFTYQPIILLINPIILLINPILQETYITFRRRYS